MYYIDHMEYLRVWAKPDRLEALRATLQRMSELSAVRVSTAWIDQRLADIASRQSNMQQAEPQSVKDVVRPTPDNIRSFHRQYTAQNLAKRSTAMRALWSDPVWKANMSEALHRSSPWNKPDMTEEERETLSTIWSNAAVRRWSKPGYKEKVKSIFARRLARERALGRPSKKKGVKQKNAAAPRGWRRNDKDPKQQKAWEDRMAKADGWAKDLDNESLDELYNKAHRILRIDVGDKQPECAGRGAHVMLYNRVVYNTAIAIGQPYWTVDEFEQTHKEAKMKSVTLEVFKRGVTKERLLWLHLAAILRLKGTVFDVERNPHLQWLV